MEPTIETVNKPNVICGTASIHIPEEDMRQIEEYCRKCAEPGYIQNDCIAELSADEVNRINSYVSEQLNKRKHKWK